MTPFLLTIALAGLLHIVQFVTASTMANMDVGPGYTTSPRDRDPMTTTCRCSRSLPPPCC